jgi:flagellin
MGLNVISNYAANVAHQNLLQSQQAATDSLAKLSSGSRVVNAKDDAASLAIGSGLRAEVAALQQASVNAGQAISVVQIADGAYARINDILVRLKTLSIQASSGQLSGTQRGQLNAEYSNLISEVDRIANVTDFNGTQLINGGFTYTTNAATNAAAGFDSFTLRGSETAGNYSVQYGTAGNNFTVNNSGETFTGAISTNVLSNAGTTNASLTQGTVVTLSSTTANSSNTVDIVLNAAFKAGTAIASNATNSFTTAGNATQNFSFQVGAGTTANDQIAVSLNAATSTALGLSGSNITSQANAQTAATLVTNAVNALGTIRSTVGAAESRLQFAETNIATATQNLEAARSNLLDLDVASEVSNFTSKQILVQLGVAELAQANQLPQTLLKLFQ